VIRGSIKRMRMILWFKGECNCGGDPGCGREIGERGEDSGFN